MYYFKYLTSLIFSLILLDCGGSSNDEVASPEPLLDIMMQDPMKTGVNSEPELADSSIPVLTLSFTPTKIFRFTWVAVPGATSYKLREAVTNGSGYEVIGETTATARSFNHIVPLYARLNAKYILQSCNADRCTASAAVFTMPRVAMTSSIGYFKASNTDPFDEFGSSVSLSADGSTLAVGAYGEGSDSALINNTSEDNNEKAVAGELDNEADNAGAVYVFTRSGAVWLQEAYLKADNAEGSANFGNSVSLSDDGNTLAVGASRKNSDAGAAYVFIRSDAAVWTQEDYLTASNAEGGDFFGTSVSLNADGNTLAVGASRESSNATGVGQDQGNGASESGAVYVFTRSGAAWQQEAYLKASNTGVDDFFGSSVSLNSNGNTLAVGARGEGSSSSQNQDNNASPLAGAVYVFTRSAEVWQQEAYLKASNTDENDAFGSSLSISDDGNTLVVGASGEASNATGINQGDGNDGAINAGAAYVFIRDTSGWGEQAYLKANNTGAGDFFGHSVSVSADGNTLAVGAYFESSDAIGIHADDTNAGASASGAVYTFTRSAAAWSAQAYLKARNTDANDQFGFSVALSADGGTLAVGANLERSNATGLINADPTDDSARQAGAVYVY